MLSYICFNFFLKIRWVVESANGRLKSWRYLNNVVPNSQIPAIHDIVCIVGALCNAFRPPLSVGDEAQDSLLAQRMLALSSQANSLTNEVDFVFQKASKKWTSLEEAEFADFSRFTEEELALFLVGVYQVKLASSYTQEHFADDGQYKVLISTDHPGILAAKFQSRFHGAVKHKCLVRYDEGTVTAWYCRCPVGARVVGACAHITALIWYLGFSRHQQGTCKPKPNWFLSVLDAKAPES